MQSVEKIYSELGGRFISGAEEITRKLQNVKAYVFDWDGVFNTGSKTADTGSSFSEVDSMGVNLLRFSYFLKHNRMPVTLVISGETNRTAFLFSKREGFSYSFYKVAHKLKALEFLCEKEKLHPSEVAFFFDDVLDIPIAEKCGVRMQVNQKINPLFLHYCEEKRASDYITSGNGGQFAVREACELLIALNGNYKEVLEGRISNSEKYQEYISIRKKTQPEFFTLSDSGITAKEPEF